MSIQFGHGMSKRALASDHAIRSLVRDRTSPLIFPAQSMNRITVPRNLALCALAFWTVFIRGGIDPQ